MYARERFVIMKNSKLKYYTKNSVRLLLPDFIYQKRLNRLLDSIDKKDADAIADRVNYYNKLSHPFSIDANATSIKAFKKVKKKTYFFDLFEYLRYFPTKLRLRFLFGDITHIPDLPTLLKSRPIEGANANSVLMNLDKVRHFIFLEDKLDFSKKKDAMVWRGASYQPHRIEFVRQYYNHPLCDVGQTNKPVENVPWQRPKMNIAEQLRYKFIFSIEGNDVASNLKWVMSSNSLAFMPKPKYETWFMEGRLIPNHHYVLIKDDYSDIEEKIHYYTKHTDEALQIIENAHRYIGQFKDSHREDIISLLVLKKYFEQSGQM